MAVVAVFLATAATSRWVGAPAATIRGGWDSPFERGGRNPFSRLFESCVHVAGRTVPLLLIGIVAAMLVARLLPAATFASPAGRMAVVALAALIAVPVALPTFFEVPLALSLLAAGTSPGAAVAVLFAGPAVNLPSLLTVGHATGWKVAAGVGVAVWLVAVAGGLWVG